MNSIYKKYDEKSKNIDAVYKENYLEYWVYKKGLVFLDCVSIKIIKAFAEHLDCNKSSDCLSILNNNGYVVEHWFNQDAFNSALNDRIYQLNQIHELFKVDLFDKHEITFNQRLEATELFELCCEESDSLNNIERLFDKFVKFIK